METPFSPLTGHDDANNDKKTYDTGPVAFAGAPPIPERLASSMVSEEAAPDIFELSARMRPDSFPKPDDVRKPDDFPKPGDAPRPGDALLEREEPIGQVINREKKTYDSAPLTFAPKPDEIRRTVSSVPAGAPVYKVDSAQDLTLDDLIKYAAGLNASDLFLKAGSRPSFKCLNRVVIGDFPVLTPADAKRLAYAHMTERHIEKFETNHELNISFTVMDAARIRQNVYYQRGSVATVCRLIPFEVRSMSDLGIASKAVMNLTREVNGLILVTGPTGCGKTTTLASIIDHINETRPANIITIEDPIEFLHKDKCGIVSQREVGVDTDSFNEALRQVLRQAPDVILIGELRDLETLNVALQAAETGHLVFATLHTSSAAETLDRISNMYPPSEREMLWLRLSVSLKGVISQKLARLADGSGRVLAMEIMVATPTISKQLEDGRSEDLYSAIRSDGEEDFWGMRTMNQCLEQFYRDNLITEEEALLHAGNLAELKQALRRATVDMDAASRRK